MTNAHVFLTYMYIRTFPFLVSDQLNNSCFWYECDPARKMKNEDTSSTLDANVVVASEDLDDDKICYAVE